MTWTLAHTVVVIFIGASLIAALVGLIKFLVAWYFAFHFVKRYKRLPTHLRPPGWPPTNL